MKIQKAFVLDFNSRVHAFDPFMASKSIQLIRTLIDQGNHAILEDMSARLSSKDSTLQFNPVWRFELARIAKLNSHWRKVIRETDACLGLQPSSILRLRALQLASIAQFELGDFTAAKRKIDYIRTMRYIHPRDEAHLKNELLSQRLPHRL